MQQDFRNIHGIIDQYTPGTYPDHNFHYTANNGAKPIIYYVGSKLESGSIGIVYRTHCLEFSLDELDDFVIKIPKSRKFRPHIEKEFRDLPPHLKGRFHFIPQPGVLIQRNLGLNFYHYLEENAQKSHKILLTLCFGLLLKAISRLELLHKKGYTHGDIKPGNLLINNKGAVSLIDFGRTEKIGATLHTHVQRKGALGFTSKARKAKEGEWSKKGWYQNFGHIAPEVLAHEYRCPYYDRKIRLTSEEEQVTSVITDIIAPAQAPHCAKNPDHIIVTIASYLFARKSFAAQFNRESAKIFTRVEKKKLNAEFNQAFSYRCAANQDLPGIGYTIQVIANALTLHASYTHTKTKDGQNSLLNLANEMQAINPAKRPSLNTAKQRIGLFFNTRLEELPNEPKPLDDEILPNYFMSAATSAGINSASFSYSDETPSTQLWRRDRQKISLTEFLKESEDKPSEKSRASNFG